eukprot:767050-Hanusia_phi.AAC.1
MEIAWIAGGGFNAKESDCTSLLVQEEGEASTFCVDVVKALPLLSLSTPSHRPPSRASLLPTSPPLRCTLPNGAR